ncbi:MAG: DMT family transporter [Leptolyngbyaceae bacterium]|nr:DMT family transporter [Leptolyngbyaceae bacterium]
MTLHRSSGQWQMGLGLSLLTVFLWGILPIALTLVLQVLDVYTLTWFRFLVSFGLLALYLAARRQLPDLRKLSAGFLKLLAIATLFLALNYLLYLQGLVQTSPATAQVVIQLAPVLMGLGALGIFKERYTRSQWVGLGVLSLGMVLFFHEQLRTLVGAPTRYLGGSGLLVLGAAAWAVYALAQKQLLQKISSPEIMLAIYGGAALLFTPTISPQPMFTLNPLQSGMLLFCALNTLVAYGAFAEALDHWDASRVSAVLSLTPLVTIASTIPASFLWPALFTLKQLTFLSLVGAVLVVSGSFAIALGKQPPSIEVSKS